MFAGRRLWSDPILQRPENLLTGVGFLYGGYNGVYGSYESGPGEGEYTVHRPDHWLLAGTGLRRGQTFGKEASIAGYEMDGCEMIFKDGLPVPTGRDGTPKDLEIVATAPGHWGNFDSSLPWARQLRKARTTSPTATAPACWACTPAAAPWSRRAAPIGLRAWPSATRSSSALRGTSSTG